MSPVIEAAWIGAAAVIASITTGTISGRWATLRTLEAARQGRLWDKQAPAYEETIAALLHRQAQRSHKLYRYRVDDGGNIVESVIPDYKPPDLFDAQGRLAVYCSPAVKAAYEAADIANEKVSVLNRQWAALGDIQRATDPADPQVHANRANMAKAIAEIRKRTKLALESADETDQKLIDLMRGEVQSRSRHSIWQRFRRLER